MALLNIAEPGQSKARLKSVKYRPALGIDLGTTNSLVAIAREGKVELLADEQGEVLLPSVVHYSANGSVQVGDLPGAAGTRISSVKRLMGRGRADIDYRPGYGLHQNDFRADCW